MLEDGDVSATDKSAASSLTPSDILPTAVARRGETNQGYLTYKTCSMIKFTDAKHLSKIYQRQ
jgi:hypothetical protein